MSNAILIREVNNSPVLFNVDNAADITRLEALQAVKMAEDLVSSVFGENVKYADNTTCTISANQDNPAFPYDIVFDASKIQAAPKRDTSVMAGLGMPSSKYINLATGALEVTYTAPANGYLCILCNTGTNFSLENLETGFTFYGSRYEPGPCGGFIPSKKGDNLKGSTSYANQMAWLRFYFAEGEL